MEYSGTMRCFRGLERDWSTLTLLVGVGVTVRVRKEDHIHIWEGFEEPLRPSFVSTSEGVREAVKVIGISMGGTGERSSTLRGI